MPKSIKPQAARGYARHPKDERRLIEAGLKPAAIYLEGRGREGWGNWKMRPGEALGVVDGLRSLGDNRRDIADAVRQVHGWGAKIVDVETGKTSADDGVDMLDEALARIHGERVMPNAKRATEMQAKSVRSRTKGRMNQREALAIWRRPELTVGEAIAKMRGWSQGTAYRTLGKRDMPVGRRGNKDGGQVVAPAVECLSHLIGLV